MQNIYKYIILGNGNAALNAAMGIRELDKENSILMVSDEDVPAYSRPMLTKTPLAGYSLDRTIIYGDEWYKDMGIDLLLGTKVLSIDNSSRIIETTGGRYFYSKLIYALGAGNFVPPITGADLPQVKTIRTYKDIYEIKRLCVDAKDAVIIGGGVIGLEAGFELARYGINVTVLEVLPVLMPRLLDEESARTLEKSISSFRVYTGVQVEEIGGTDSVSYVKLADGRRFDADFVVISAGVRANTALAQAAGIKCAKGVMINEKCETWSKDIYACGDCAEQDGVNYALWSQAKEQGRVAGMNAAGGRESIQPFDNSMIINSPEISMFACGDVGKNPDLSYTTEIDDRNQPELYGVNKKYMKAYEKRFYVDGKLVGAVIIGNLARMQTLKEQIIGIKPAEV